MRHFFIPSVVLGVCLAVILPQHIYAASLHDVLTGSARTLTETPADRDDARALEHYINARVLAMRAGEPQKIVVYLKKVIAQYPQIAALHVYLAEQYLRMQAVDQALAATQTASTLDPTYVPAYLLRSRLLVVQNQFDKAIAELETLRKRIPTDEDVFTTLARLYMQQQQYARALQIMQEYLRREPESLTAYYYLGTLYGTHLKQYDRAIAMFRRLINLQPENIQARKALVQIYLNRDDLRGALHELSALEQHAVGDLSVQVRIAVLHYELKEYDQAIQCIEHVLQQTPHANKLRYYLGVIYEESGHFEQAKDTYDELPTSSSYFKDAMMRVATYYMRHQQLDEAIATLEDGVRRNKTVPEFYEYLTFLYQQKKDDAGAIRVLRRATHQFAKQPRFFYTLGILYERTRDRSKAVRAMLGVLKLQPENALAMNYVAYMYVEWGKKLDQAEAMLQKAIELQPTDGRIVDSLGWLYYRRGEYAKALDLLERADALSPDEPTILRHIAQTLIATGRKQDAASLLQHAATLVKQQSPAEVEELSAIQRVLATLEK